MVGIEIRRAREVRVQWRFHRFPGMVQTSCWRQTKQSFPKWNESERWSAVPRRNEHLSPLNSVHINLSGDYTLGSRAKTWRRGISSVALSSGLIAAYDQGSTYIFAGGRRVCTGRSALALPRATFLAGGFRFRAFARRGLVSCHSDCPQQDRARRARMCWRTY